MVFPLTFPILLFSARPNKRREEKHPDTDISRPYYEKVAESDSKTGDFRSVVQSSVHDHKVFLFPCAPPPRAQGGGRTAELGDLSPAPFRLSRTPRHPSTGRTEQSRAARRNRERQLTKKPTSGQGGQVGQFIAQIGNLGDILDNRAINFFNKIAKKAQISGFE